MDWNQRYVCGDTPWEKGSAAPALRGAIQRFSVSGRVAVPGCGTGHDVRELAAAGCTVVGLDIAPLGLELARQFDPVGSEIYQLGSLFDDALLSRLGGFDWIFEHTCFCAIDPDRRADYVQAVASLLKPDGHLLGVFYTNFPGDDGTGPPYGVSEQAVRTLFRSAFSVVHWETPTVHYPDRPLGSESLVVLAKL